MEIQRSRLQEEVAQHGTQDPSLIDTIQQIKEFDTNINELKRNLES